MCLNVAAFVLIMAGTFVPLLTAAGVSLLGLKFLYGTYKKMWAISVTIFHTGSCSHQSGTTSPSSAWYLGAYITALTCILFVIHSDHPGVLTEDLVWGIIQQYKDQRSPRHHALIRNMDVLHHFERKIAKLILEETNTPETGRLNSVMDSADPCRNDGESEKHWWKLFGKRS